MTLPYPDFAILAVSLPDDWAIVAGYLSLGILICGWIAAVHALFTTRTSQGTTAWVVSLVLMPMVSLPFYLLLGRNRFQGYVDIRRARSRDFNITGEDLRKLIPRYKAELSPEIQHRYGILEDMAVMPFTKENGVRLHPNGKEVFEKMFAAINAAKNYVVIQFYTVKNDHLGNELKRRLIAKAREGVSIYFLTDAIGSHDLPEDYYDSLEQAGVKTARFGVGKGFWNKFQINFRNHRKLVVIDGLHGFTGGHNVGREYLGEVRKFGDWRDTTGEIAGPAVLELQLSFLDDWHWAASSIPELNWEQDDNIDNLVPDDGESRYARDAVAIVVPTGPADMLENGGLFFTHLINSAKSDLWISSPYFIPDQSQTTAIQLAAMRGVNVRIILPRISDRFLTRLGNDAFAHQFDHRNIQIYHFLPGFLHQKVILIDDELAAIGTANFDNRSFRLNFELMLCVLDKRFAWQTRQMLESDVKNSLPISADFMKDEPFLRRLASRATRLLAPVL